MEQVQKQHSEKKQEEPVQEELPKKNNGEDLKAELDALLDEIDEVLEANAEDFVKSYVQKNGE